MWPFKRKKTDSRAVLSGPRCSRCGSTDTKVITHHGTDQADFVRVWRGQRYVTCRCSGCGQDFYTGEAGNIVEMELDNDDRVDDPQALQAAEDELKRQVDEEDDRMFQ